MKDQKDRNKKAFHPKRVNDLDLLPYAAFIKKDSSGQLWDPVRRKWLVPTPEEHVRLSLVHGLKDKYDVSFRRMAAERQLTVKQHLRFDILVFDNTGTPLLLVECKSPEHSLRTEHVIQLGNYNEELNARFVMLTNGINSLAIDLRSNEFLNSLSHCFHTNL